MPLIKNGYVDTYNVDSSSGLYTCQVNTIDEDSLRQKFMSNMISSPNGNINTPSTNLTILNAFSKITIPTTTTTTAVFVPIKMPSSYNIKSPNDPGQVIVMSRDNKYIFINVLELKDELRLKDIYTFLSTSLKYQIPIPSIVNMEITIFGSMFYEPEDDGTYGKLPNDTDINQSLKFSYKCYLVSSKPPPFLIAFNTDLTVWKNISYYFKAMYDEQNSNVDISKFCLNIAMDKQPESTISCSSRKDASDSIIPSYSLTDVGSIYNAYPYLIYGCLAVIILCSCCMSCLVASKGK